MDPHDLDMAEVAQSFSRAANTYDESAVMQRQAGESLRSRLSLMAIKPQIIMDVGCGTGVHTQALKIQYPDARVVALDISMGMLRQLQERSSSIISMCGDAMHLPVADHSVDLIFSNMTLHWCTDLVALIRELHRVLRLEGLLLFSTLGPDTLLELRQSWQAVDQLSHVNRFWDMHDIGDQLVNGGFSDPVMDMEEYVLTYPNVFSLMRDLKAIGAHNLTLNRYHTLMGKGRLRTLFNAYESFRLPDGYYPATYEVIYGQAWGTGTNRLHRVNEFGEVVIPLADVVKTP